MELRHSTHIARAQQTAARKIAAPPLNRTSMAPRIGDGDVPSDSPDPRGHWQASGVARRLVLLALTITQTAIATDFLATVLPYSGRHALELGILVLFAILFFWISAGFWTAMAGAVLVISGRDRYAIARTASRFTPLPRNARTAIVVPIRNEDPARVFAGLQATYRSLERAGTLEHFDFFVLSDTNDAQVRLAEIAGWRALCEATHGAQRIFYRSRKQNIKRKSGNIADFCRRWGANYRYMVVLDADSVMSGECLSMLVRLMEANPNAGIIQSAPVAVGRDTLHARVQQFAGRVYGPVYTAGLHFWQLGEAHYWGHNAIIRIAPFMRHCALPRLPGRGALSGEILSHDFVEAALMRRAGWAVWIAYDLPGSFEETPPNLSDELTRDRRWCHGNLMNSRLTVLPGLHPAHRFMFMSGVMAYVAAPLWLLLLALSTALLAVHTMGSPRYFVEPFQLFPLWPEWHPYRAITLFSTTALVLFLPKVVAIVVALWRDARGFGGPIRLLASACMEWILSALLAPVRMLFHSRFVVAALLGWRTGWKSPPRTDAETSWSDALSRHGAHTVIGISWALFVFSLSPSFLWWLAPVVGALMVSIPLATYTSRVAPGKRARALGLFVIPEESRPPREIQMLHTATATVSARPGARNDPRNPSTFHSHAP